MAPIQNIAQQCSPRTRILSLKFHLRKGKRGLDDTYNELRALRRQRKKFETAESSRFNRHRIQEIDQAIAHQETCKALWNHVMDYLSRELIGAMRAYEATSPSLHEMAQLLSISHIALEKWWRIEKCEKTLFHLAFFHAECAGEKESFIGESGNRDHPIFDACQRYFIWLTQNNQEFAKNMQDFTSNWMAENGVPSYTIVTKPNGQQEMVRNPPRLRVIDGTHREGA